MSNGLAVAAGGLALVLAACAPLPGVVSSFNGNSVTLQQDTTFSLPGRTPQMDAEAERICRQGGKQRAEYASWRSLPYAYAAEHLYLCLD